MVAWHTLQSLGYQYGTIPMSIYKSNKGLLIRGKGNHTYIGTRKQSETSEDLHITIGARLSAGQRSTLEGCAALTYFATIIILLIPYRALLVAVAGQFGARVV